MQIVRRFIVPVLAVLLLLVAVRVKGQDEGSSAIVTITVPMQTNCGTSPLYCYGVPFTTNGGDFVSGTFWSDIFSTYGFIAGLGTHGWDLGTIQLGSIVKSYDAQGFLNAVDFTLSGTTTDGDNQTFSGTGHFTFTHGPVMRYGTHYYYMQAGSGFSVIYN
jgi:hypothetical protein